MKYLNLRQEIIDQLELGNIILIDKCTGEQIDITVAVKERKNKTNLNMQFIKMHTKNIYKINSHLTKPEQLYLLLLAQTVKSNHVIDCGVFLGHIGKDRSYRIQKKFIKLGIIKKLEINDKPERFYLNPVVATASKSIDKAVLIPFKEDIIRMEILEDDVLDKLLK